jgi:hypothetical protein
MACNLRLLMELENCTLRKKRTRSHLWIGVFLENGQQDVIRRRINENDYCQRVARTGQVMERRLRYGEVTLSPTPVLQHFDACAGQCPRTIACEMLLFD